MTCTHGHGYCPKCAPPDTEATRISELEQMVDRLQERCTHLYEETMTLKHRSELAARLLELQDDWSFDGGRRTDFEGYGRKVSDLVVETRKKWREAP